MLNSFRHDRFLVVYIQQFMYRSLYVLNLNHFYSLKPCRPVRHTRTVSLRTEQQSVHGQHKPQNVLVDISHSIGVASEPAALPSIAMIRSADCTVRFNSASDVGNGRDEKTSLRNDYQDFGQQCGRTDADPVTIGCYPPDGSQYRPSPKPTPAWWRNRRDVSSLFETLLMAFVYLGSFYPPFIPAHIYPIKRDQFLH